MHSSLKCIVTAYSVSYPLQNVLKDCFKAPSHEADINKFVSFGSNPSERDTGLSLNSLIRITFSTETAIQMKMYGYRV